MKTQTSPPEEAPRRRWDRHDFEKEVSLDLSGGRHFTGETRNVSLKGVFLAAGSSGAGVKEGETGTLNVTTHEGITTFPCRVARVTPEGLAIEILERAAAFGMLLTQDIFQELQSAHPKPALKGPGKRR